MEYLTVVFEIHDKDKFRPEAARLINMIGEPVNTELGYTVTSAARSDVMSRLDAIEKVIVETDEDGYTDTYDQIAEIKNILNK